MSDLDIQTHRAIRHELCGEPVELVAGFCRARLTTTPEMAADDRGLVHGGFLFGLADHAAMLAINHPNVVLGSAQTRFLKPVVVGETVDATASLVDSEGPRHLVAVEVRQGEELVLSGELVCFTLDRHVLDRPSST